jgi:hypothetical protein
MTSAVPVSLRRRHCSERCLPSSGGEIASGLPNDMSSPSIG